ncbi:MAG TPA: branched-chain amino acid transaminase [Nitrososphaeraceae archaeon]|jgi:branched-chain amino acid aminotransferase|nr:branched-chain amino acid transaminase [Nitrososphaeraceae archaeon]
MNNGHIWIDGSFYKWDEAKIHVLTHSLHYGTAVFEGIRCYNTVKGPAIFRLEDHVNRLFNSAKIYFMNIEFSKEQIEDAIIDTTKKNRIDECYIRPLAYFGYGKMGINPLSNKVSVAIALWRWDEYLKKEDVNHGVRVMVSGWMRIDARTMPIHAKATANYANSALARIEAIKAGFDEALMLNTDGMVVEASGENIFIVKNNVLITPPTASGALEGITRDTVLRLAKDDNIITEIRDISKDELYLADEVFLTGTAAEIKAVGEIDNRRIGNGGIEKITLQLKSLFDDLTRGNHKYSTEWLSYINID